MIGSQTAAYALRILSYMSVRATGDPIPARDLSKAVDIPPFYLSKIMRRLVEAGLLHSKKGHGGGFTIARPLGEIQFADVLRAVEQDARPEGCVFGWDECSEEHPCPLHPFWKQLKDELAAWSRTHTLADVRDINA